MSTLLSSWKTSIVGVVAGAAYLFAQSYQAGMSWKQWVVAGALALGGILAKDFDVAPPASK